MRASAPRPRVYLAGPDVFYPEVEAIAAEKKAICARFGFEGVFPLDGALDLSQLAPQARGLAISRANEALMRGCDLVVANMTPFRGPSADVGTAYEMGFMRALGRPVFAYSNVALPFTERVWQHLRESDGMEIEAFEMVDNLMLDGGVLASGGAIVARDLPPAALDAFTEAVRIAAERLLAPRAAS